MINESMLQSARVIKVIDHGTITQLLCQDDRGLISVYFDNKPFERFNSFVKKAGLSLMGLDIEFNTERVNITSKGKIIRTCPTRQKTLVS